MIVRHCRALIGAAGLWLALGGETAAMPRPTPSPDSVTVAPTPAKILAASADAFKDANVTESSDRDSLEERTQTAATGLALTLSNRGYGGAHFAAAQLYAHAREARALLSLSDVLEAQGVKTVAELLAKHTGRPLADVQRLERRASASARLLAALADNAPRLTAKASRRELARRLAPTAPAAHDWLATKAPSAARAAPSRLAILCFDGKRRVVPCKVTVSP